VLRLFYTGARKVLGEVQARDILERPAKGESAHPCLPGDCGQTEIFSVSVFDEFPGAHDLRRLSRLLPQHDLVGQRAELVGEELEQPHGRFIFAPADHPRSVVAAGGFGPVELEAPFLDLLEGAFRMVRRWRLQENLPGLEVSDDLAAQFYSHGGFAEAKRATHRAGHTIDAFADALLHLETGRAGGARL